MPINKGEPHKPTIKKLYQWRAAVWKDHHSLAIWPASSILSNAHAQLLASVGSLPSFERLKQLVGIQWGWWDKYGDSLWQMLEGLEIPFVPIGKSKKRKEREDINERGDDAPPAKRPAQRAVTVDGCGTESKGSLTAVDSIHTSHAGASQPRVYNHSPSPLTATLTDDRSSSSDSRNAYIDNRNAYNAHPHRHPLHYTHNYFSESVQHSSTSTANSSYAMTPPSTNLYRNQPIQQSSYRSLILLQLPPLIDLIRLQSLKTTDI
ncbi:hypothetical protein BDP27DRAFT_1426429 [Rhodocollybia butyracea]|uniref:Uncharacterized protein n=1 Tax=Rhodocollybia butyracea TaxID=206335 RepID=A0A9P5U1P4_9AGAR|nr:hypothetical protein BDP27DRAFT_1426429 [Rhodocollybia butyracea]